MRTSLLLAALSIFTVSLFACSDADQSTGSMGRRGKSTKSPPAAGTAADHDSDEDTTDENTPDEGNPNAKQLPDQPSTPGQTSTSTFSLASATTTPTVGLGESAELDVTVTSKAGFAGAVDFTVTGLPAGVTAGPAQATVAANGTATAKIPLKSDVTAVPSASGTMSPIAIVGKAGAASATVNANLKIAPTLKLTIPLNIDALRAAGTQYRNEWGTAFGATQQPLKTQQGNGIVVTVFNADSKQHIIHGANGFAHGSTTAGQEIKPNAFEMQGGNVRTRTLNVGANANGYPHDGAQGPGASFRIKVEAAAAAN